MLCIFSVCDVTAVLSALTCSCHCSVAVAAFVMGTVASFAMMDLLGGGFEPEKDEGDVLEWYDGWKHWWPSRVWVASPLTRHSEVVCVRRMVGAKTTFSSTLAVPVVSDLLY